MSATTWLGRVIIAAIVFDPGGPMQTILDDLHWAHNTKETFR